MSSQAMTLLRNGLRNNRTGLIVLAALGAVFAFANAAAYAQIAGDTVSERMKFGQEMQILGQQFTYLLPVPDRVDTLGGFVHWRAFGIFSLMFGVWGVMAGTGSTRAQEERGSWEMWLAAGASRAGLMGLTVAGFFAVAAVPAIVTGLAAVAGAQAGATLPGDELALGAVMGESLSLFLLTIASFAIGTLAAQLMASGRGALGLGATVVVGLFFLNSLSRTLDLLRTVAWLSPFYWFDKTDSMVPGGSVSVPGVLVPLAIALVAASLATLIFVRRDLGAALISRATDKAATHTISNNPLLRIPVIADIYEQRISLAFWFAGVVIMGAFIGSVAKTALDFLQDTPALASYVQFILGGADNVYEAMIGYTGFNLMQLILAAFSVTVVSRWATDDTEGRLEIILSAPISRWRVVIERALMLATVSLALIVLGIAVMSGTIVAQGVDINMGRMLGESTLMLPFALAFAGAGAALATWQPRAAVPVLAVIATISFLLVQIGPLLEWPNWVLDLSVFSLVGNPIVTGVYWVGLSALLAVAVVGFGTALRNIQVRDVGR